MITKFRPLPHSSQWTGPTRAQELYQAYSSQEDKERTNIHYEQPAEFFYAIVGGEWHTYSCNLWSDATTDTESQEAKLDLLAQLMGLRSGQRILDIGCGWGGPLAYLSKTYGVQATGLTLSPAQKRMAEKRIAQYGVDVQIIESHWRDYQDERGFDVVFTDEILAHVTDLGGFFAKVYSLLHSGGRILNKELHFTNSRYKQLSRAATFIHEIYGLTGNYRTLGEELILLDENGFELEAVHQISQAHYRKTAERWLSNMYQHSEQLQELVGAEYYRRFRIYLKLVRKLFTRRTMTIDVVVGSKL